MKSNLQQKVEVNKIRVNHIYYNFRDPEVELYYLEKLNVFIFQSDAGLAMECNFKRIIVRALERGIDNQLHFYENRLTRQIQRVIEQELTKDSETPIIVQEETEEIIIKNDNCIKICTFKQLQNEFQIGIRNYNDKNLNDIGVFEKYYIGFDKNQVYVFRKNNMKILMRQIVKKAWPQTQSSHLLTIRRSEVVLFYKRSSFKLKIIRKYNIQNDQSFLYFQGRYFAVKNEQLMVIDLTNMRQQQYDNLLKDHVGFDSIQQLGIFLIQYESKDNIKDLNSMKLQKNTLVQTLISYDYQLFIKYSHSLGLLIFHYQD